MHQTNSESRSFLFFQLFLLAGLIYFTCFWRLGETSIQEYDEVVAVRSVQNIHQEGNWLLPNIDGKPYLRKPPFKMWVAQLPLYFLGESNFSLRLVDALAGAVTTILVFFFSRSVFGLWGVGFFSAIALLGCQGYILNHCVRSAVHDSMLTLLSTAAIFCGWFYLEGLKKELPQSKNQRWVFGLALFMGLAMLTKSIAGLFPMLVLAPFALGDRNLLKSLWRSRAALLGAGFLALIIPATYFGYHFLFTEGAWAMMVKHEVVRRITDGFHHQGHKYFYFRALLFKNLYVPPFLFISGLFLSSYFWFRGRESAHLFLLVWSIIPLLVLNTIPSRLEWYLAPALPGMAILCGVALGLFLRGLDFATEANISSGILRKSLLVFAVALSLNGAAFLVQNNYRVIASIKHLPDRLALDRFVAGLNEQDSNPQPLRGGPILLDKVPLSGADKVYLTMLGKRLVKLSPADDLLKVFSAHPTAILITRIMAAIELIRQTDIAGYGFIRADMYRDVALTVLSRTADNLVPPLLPTSQVFHFGMDQIRLLHGFHAPRSEKKRLVRDSFGNDVAFTISGDRLLYRLGGLLSVKSALHPLAAEQVKNVEVFLNFQKLGTFAPERDKFRTAEFVISPEQLMPGENVISLRTATKEQNSDRKFLMLEKVVVSLLDRNASLIRK